MIQEIPTIQEWLKKKPVKKDAELKKQLVEETPTIQEWITKKRERADQQRPPVMPLKTRDTKPPEPVEPVESQAEEIPTINKWLKRKEGKERPKINILKDVGQRYQDVSKTIIDVAGGLAGFIPGAGRRIVGRALGESKEEAKAKGQEWAQVPREVLYLGQQAPPEMTGPAQALMAPIEQVVSPLIHDASVRVSNLSGETVDKKTGEKKPRIAVEDVEMVIEFALAASMGKGVIAKGIKSGKVTFGDITKIAKRNKIPQAEALAKMPQDMSIGELLDTAQKVKPKKIKVRTFKQEGADIVETARPSIIEEGVLKKVTIEKGKPVEGVSPKAEKGGKPTAPEAPKASFVTELTPEQSKIMSKVAKQTEAYKAFKKEADAFKPAGETTNLGKVTEKHLTEKRTLMDESPGMGLSVEQTVRGMGEGKYSFINPEIEVRFTQAKGMTKPTVGRRLSDFATSIHNKMTRTYEALPRGAKYAEAHESLRRLGHQRSVQFHYATEAIDGVTLKLNKPGYDLFTRKVVLDDLMAEAKAGRDLPFGFNKDSLGVEHVRLVGEVGKHADVTDALARRKEVLDAVRSDYSQAAKDAGLPYQDKFTKDDYYRHQVLEFARAKSILGAGKKLKTPTGRSFLKQRKGGEFDINTDYLEAEMEVVSQLLYDTEVYRTFSRINKEYNIVDKLKSQAKEQGVARWQELLPEDHGVWQPREGSTFYSTHTIAERYIRDIMEGTLESLDVTPDMIGEALAVGRKKQQWVLPKELIETLDNFGRAEPPSFIRDASRKAIRTWKKWILGQPRKAVKYNARNLTGDADHVFVGNPSTFKYAPRAFSEIWDAMVSKKGFSENFKDWFDRGGMESTLTQQEIGQLKGTKAFQRLYSEKNAGLNVWKRYWNAVRGATNFREATLRYADYLNRLEQMKKSPDGMPKNFGASLKEEVRALTDVKDRAFKMSNDLLGAYDDISVFGKQIREHLYPFWSWKELNARTYWRLLKNEVTDVGVAKTVGNKVLRGVAKSPATAYRVGKLAVKASAVWATVQAWNTLMFPELEEGLPKEVRDRPHMIFGKDKHGETIYFSRLGALGDLLEWVGLDAPQRIVSDLASGNKTLKEVGVEMLVESPINVIVQGISPFYKIVPEWFSRRSFFPEATNPKTIRDRGLHLARALGLENEYTAAFKPSEPYLRSLSKIAVYKSDPNQAAYNEIFNIKSDFQKKAGKGGEGFWITPRGQALYNMKLAHRFGDKKAEEKYLKKYWALHILEAGKVGKSKEETEKSFRSGLTTSINNMYPLSGLAVKERSVFVQSLTDDERLTLARAIVFWNDTLLGATPIDEEALRKSLGVK